MDFIPKDTFLDIASDSMSYIRKEHGLDGPGRMKEAVEILRDWIKMQDHFKKKEFETFYLETTIFGCKGSIERAKTRLDKMCTMRTLLPHFFDTADLGNLKDKLSLIVLPKHTKDHCRVVIIKPYGTTFTTCEIRDFFKLGIIMAEYEKIHDYVNGFIVIVDLTAINIMDLVSAINIIEFKQAISIFLDGYGMRLKSIQILSESKLVDTFLSILKKVLTNKIANRIHLNNTVDELYKHLPREILPEDYSGDAESIKNINKQWLDVIFSQDHLNYVRDMNEARTDESLRQRDQFTDQYASVPGTFKLLHID